MPTVLSIAAVFVVIAAKELDVVVNVVVVAVVMVVAKVLVGFDAADAFILALDAILLLSPGAAAAASVSVATAATNVAAPPLVTVLVVVP